MREHVNKGLMVCIAVVMIIAIAKPHVAANQIKPRKGGHPAVSIPDHAIEIVQGKVFWLGTALEKGQLVEGFAIIHLKKDYAKSTGCNNDGKCQGWEDQTCSDCIGGGGSSGTSTCYGFLAKGAKWKTVEDYIVDTDNLAGLNDVFIRGNIAANIDKWEDAADGTMTDGYIMNIIGDETTGEVDGADMISPDGKNEVLFGNIDSPGAIGVTFVWGILRGSPAGRELVEWDQVYDDWDYAWSEDCSSKDCTNKMDFENIAIHELGHTFGLGDLNGNACSEETMYGYSDEGETNKRTLEAGDINGIYELYK